MLLKIEGPRSHFWQWDLNRRLIVSDEVCGEVHFCNGTTENALVCAVYQEDGQRFVNVPNVLLQYDRPLNAYLYQHGETDCATAYQQFFHVATRNKPEGYVYTETEVKTFANLERRLNAIEQIAVGGGSLLPVGGTKGQVLAKASDEPHDVTWKDPILYTEVSNDFGGKTVTIGGV